MKKIYVIDGNSLLFRAFYATSYGDVTSIMRTKDGIPTNAIFAFGNMLSKLLGSVELGDGFFVGFDADSKTFRKAEFEQYKANRKPCPPEHAEQFPISREFLKSLGVPHYEESGIEADDICGTVAKKAAKQGYQVEVYTSDKDYLQLVDDRITVNLIRKGMSDIQRVTPSSMVELFGFTPMQIIDYKGLRGDASDNLPGIPGVGEKTAVKLINEFGDFESIVKAAKEGAIKGKVGENIVAGEELGRQCLHLATILIDAELPFTLDDLAYQGYDFDALNAFCRRYELRQFMARLPGSLKKGESGHEVPEVETLSSLEGFEIGEKLGICLDYSPDSYNDIEPDGIALSNGKRIVYLSFLDAVSDPLFKKAIEDPSIKKKVYDGKAIEVCLAKKGIEIQGIDFDLLLSAYLLDSSLDASLSSVFSFLGVDVLGDSSSAPSLFSAGSPVPTGRAAYFCLALEAKSLASLKEADALKLLEEIELPLSRVLAKMEIEGFPIDKDTLEEIGSSFRKKKDELQKEITEIAGFPLNASSPKQVADLLFVKLGLAGGKVPGTSVEVLNEYKDAHPIVSKILEYRKYSKLVGTYIDGLVPHVKEDGKIHTCFNQAQTTTGRLSSSNPNLQNISARDEESRAIRKAFYYPDEDIEIASFDYSQIELRVLASLSKCQAYIDVFNSDRDIHTETARRIFAVPEGEEVTSLQRRKAKAVNFAIIYGVTPFGLAQQIQGTPKEAMEMIASFKRHYPEVDSYLQKIISDVERQGYVTTMFGRRRYLRDISDANYAKREAAKRAALNAPVQGSAADLIKIAMLEVDKLLKEGGYKTKMVLQIHDELLFAVPKQEKETVLPIIKEKMEHAVSLLTKLTVEGSIGRSWFDAKE